MSYDESTLKSMTTDDLHAHRNKLLSDVAELQKTAAVIAVELRKRNALENATAKAARFSKSEQAALGLDPEKVKAAAAASRARLAACKQLVKSAE